MTEELWIALVDVVVGLVLYFGAKYLTPELSGDVTFVIGILQPFVLALIARAFVARAAGFVRGLVDHAVEELRGPLR